MGNKILMKRSAVPGKVPTTTDLHAGELGINTSDGKMYFGTGSDVIELASANSLSGYVPVTQLGVANGVATLDSTSKIPASQLPAVAITNTFVVNTQTAMLGLDAQTGDIAIRTDLSKTFILMGQDPTSLTDWHELESPTAAVSSVNGMVGDVVVSSITGNAGTASALQTARTISLIGDTSGSTSFDGSSDVAIATTLADSGVVAGTYENSATEITPLVIDAKGRVTSVGTPITITPSFNSITDKPTTLAGYGITDAAQSSPGSGYILQTITGPINSSSGTTQIPKDNTVPQINEGTEIWNVTITPTYSTSRVGISFTAAVDASTNNRTIIIAVFRDSECISAMVNEIDTASHPKNMTLVFVDTPNTTSPVTYSARIGIDANSTWYCNSTAAGTNLGGVLLSNVRIDEIA